MTSCYQSDICMGLGSHCKHYDTRVQHDRDVMFPGASAEERHQRYMTICLRCAGLTFNAGLQSNFTTRCLLTLFLPSSQHWFNLTLIPFLQRTNGRFSLVHIAKITGSHSLTLLPTMEVMKKFQCDHIHRMIRTYDREVEIPILVISPSVHSSSSFLLHFGLNPKFCARQRDDEQIQTNLGWLVSTMPVIHRSFGRECREYINHRLLVEELHCTTNGCPLTASFECHCKNIHDRHGYCSKSCQHDDVIHHKPKKRREKKKPPIAKVMIPEVHAVLAAEDFPLQTFPTIHYGPPGGLMFF